MWIVLLCALWSQTEPSQTESGQPEPAAYELLGRNDEGALVFRRAVDDARVVWVPAGPFMKMTYTDRFSEPRRARTESVDGFAIDETEVTNRRFCRFLADVGVDADDEGNRYLVEVGQGIRRGDDGWSPAPGCDDLPALGVTGHGALAYARWVGGDLPTEEEWQKAAGRTDRGCAFPGEPTSRPRITPTTGGSVRTPPLPVGGRVAGRSPYGVLDMAGNVSERVHSERMARPEMIRGGSWASTHPLSLRTAHMSGQPMHVGDRTVGFRCVARAGSGLPTDDADLARMLAGGSTWTRPEVDAVAPPPLPDPPALRTARTWEAAKEEALARNVPILVSLQFDASSPCDRTRVGLYRDPTFVDHMNEHAVLAIGMIAWHAEDDPHPPDDDGSCPILPGMTCGEHDALWYAARDELVVVRAGPANFILDPRHAGDIERFILAGHRELPRWGGGADVILERLREAQELLGEGIPYSAWDQASR